VVTGLVGAMGGAGGVHLASTLGLSKPLTGDAYQAGLGVAGFAVVALPALTAVKSGWRPRWPALVGPPVRSVSDRRFRSIAW
jgi:MFS transporter, NNP family, nitrate/nitrite transporter